MKYTIGIDPGKDTGFAVYDRQAKIICQTKLTDFWGAVDLMQAYPVEAVHKVIVELPRSKTVWHDAKSKGAIQRTSVNVGSGLREAELLVDYLKRQGYSVVTQHPYGKKDAKQVKRITGYRGRTNEHTRDAIMLCYGV